MGVLKRFGKSLQIGHPIMAANKGDRCFREELFDDAHRLLQAADADPCCVKWETDLLVFGPMPACPNAQFEAPT